MSDLSNERVDRIMEGETPLPLAPYSLIKLLEAGAHYTEVHLSANVVSNPRSFSTAIKKLDDLQAIIGNPRLEEFAAQLVRDHFGLKESDLIIEAELISHHNLPPPINPEKPSTTIGPDLLPELNKRLFINAIIQGAGHGVQYRFLYEDKKCDELDPELRSISKSLMALADTAVWTQDERGFDHSKMRPAGIVQLDFSTKPITIRAKAVHFPVLIHEISKGVVEVLALSGLPKDELTRKSVLVHADQPEKEAWGIAIGSELWRRLSKTLPYNATPRERACLLKQFFELRPEQFIAEIEKLAD